MKQIKVSVIIPCYNCASWIEKCLDAFARQTFKEFEVICVNDCSTDHTKEVISRYSETATFRLHFIENKNNFGPAVSRNNAVKVAKGEWLAFCDSDDWYDPDFLSIMLSTAEEETSDLVMCEYRKVFESGKQSEDVRYLSAIPDNPTIDDYLVYSKASFCLLLVKKTVFEKQDIPDLRNGEDIAYVPCVESRAKKISVVKEVLYNYLIRESSLSSNTTKSVYKSLLTAYAFVENNISGDYKNAVEYLGIRNVLYGVTINAFKVGIYGREVKGILDSFESKYPNWQNNSYMSVFSRAKRIYLFFLRKRVFVVCRIMAKIHSTLAV